MDWTNWHKQYETSPQFRARLELVRGQIAAALDEHPPGPIRIVSLCAGDGRDVLGAVRDHPRRGDVTAWLLDLEGESLRRGRAAAEAAGLADQLHFQEADATLAETYAGIVPADLVLVSGILGHLRHEEVPRLVNSLRMMCRTGGTVIWNRHWVIHDGKEMVPRIRTLLSDAGFVERHFESASPDGFAVGRARFTGEVVPLNGAGALFAIAGLDQILGERNGRAASSGNGLHSVAQAASEIGDVEDSVPARFARVAALHADRKAIGSGSWQPAYRELNAAANRLAHRLIGLGGASGDRVALLLPHDGPLIGAVLGVLKAGRAVVALNPADPPPRLKQIIDEVEPAAIVTDPARQELAAQILAPGAKLVLIGDAADGPEHDPDIPIAPGSLAYLIFTSGSTGRPKGVMQTHRNLVHNALRLSRGMGVGCEDKITLLAALTGGQGVSTVWCALLNGAELCPFPIMDRGVAGLAEWMRERRITVYVSAASVFRHFVRTLREEDSFPSVRVVRLGSELANAADFGNFRKHFGQGSFLLNTFSSSETGNVTQQPLPLNAAIAEGPLPVGRPADGMEIALLDEQGREVAEGETGEIVVRGRYLSPGYWRSEALTAQRFSDGPGGTRCFHTGDLGRFGPGRTLTVIGRKDNRVKVRGYRVELSEIEEVLNQQPAVAQAVVCSQNVAGEDVQLNAYVVRRHGQECSAETLRRELRAVLPSYMLPAAFVFVDALPLNAHGKVDRQKLSAIVPPAPAPSAFDEPLSETEQWLAGVWSEVLRCENVGRQQDFFEVGGDSLKAAVIAARVHAAMGVNLELRAFSEYSRLISLAAEIDRLRESGDTGKLPPIVRVPREGHLPLSFSQERMWKFANTPDGAGYHTVSMSYRIEGPLNLAAFRECLDHLVARHEIIRSTFAQTNGVPSHVVHPPGPADFEFIDLTGAPDAEAQARQLFRREARHLFDLSRPLLMKFKLVRFKPEEHWFLRVNNHLISDAWSWTVFFQELAQLYEARVQGRPMPLPAFEPLQYADYAAWQRRVLSPESAAYRETIDWWSRFLSGGRVRTRPPFRRLWRKRDVKPVEGQIRWGIDPEASQRLDQIGRATGATFFVTRLAVFAAVLAAASRSEEVVLGTSVTNRTRVEVQNMFGFFANLVTLRLRCDRRQTFREWVRIVRQNVGEVQAHSHVPYDQVFDALQSRGIKPPKIRAVFSIDRNAPIEFGQLKISWLDRQIESMPWGFRLVFDQFREANECFVMFDAHVYSPKRVRKFIERLQRFLNAASLEPDRPLRELL